MQINGLFEETARDSIIALCGRTEVHSVAAFFDHTVQVLPLTCLLDVSLVKLPTSAVRSLAASAYDGQPWGTLVAQWCKEAWSKNPHVPASFPRCDEDSRVMSRISEHRPA